MGHHSHSSGTLLRGLCFQSMDFHQSTAHKITGQTFDFVRHYFQTRPGEKGYLQNLFCNLIWCPQTLWPPLWSGNEVLLHPPHRARLRLLVEKQYITSEYINKQAKAQRSHIFNNTEDGFQFLTLWMVDKCCDPEVWNFGYEFWSLLEEWLT